MSNIRTRLGRIGILIAISLAASACQFTVDSDDAAETGNQVGTADPATAPDATDAEPIVAQVATEQQDETQSETAKEPVSAGPGSDLGANLAAMEAFGLDFEQMMPAAAACSQAEGVDARFVSIERFYENVTAGVDDDFFETLDETTQALVDPDSVTNPQAFDDAMGMLGILYAAGLGADTTDQTTVDIIMSCVFLATAEDMMGDASPFTMPENG